MSFSKGFTKHAAFDHNNAGLEFKEMDTSPLPGTGPGGMAPSGLAAYEPTPKTQPETQKIRKKSKKATPAIAQMVFGKLGSVGGDSYFEAGANLTSGAASPPVEQLKNDTLTPWSTEQIGNSDPKSKASFRKYMRAKKK